MKVLAGLQLNVLGKHIFTLSLPASGVAMSFQFLPLSSHHLLLCVFFLLRKLVIGFRVYPGHLR